MLTSTPTFHRNIQKKGFSPEFKSKVLIALERLQPKNVSGKIDLIQEGMKIHAHLKKSGINHPILSSDSLPIVSRELTEIGIIALLIREAKFPDPY